MPDVKEWFDDIGPLTDFHTQTPGKPVAADDSDPMPYDGDTSDELGGNE